MVDERQRMTTDPNRQHYGPAGGPNRWDMDWPSQGMPKGYQHRYRRNEQPSNRQPLLNQPPMERPSYDWPGQPSYNEWMQSIDPNREGQPSPKQHPNPRMRHINPRGMNQALSSLDSLTKKNRGLEEELSEIYKQQDRARMHPLFPSPGPWNEFDPVSSEANYDPNDPRAQAWENDQGGLESLESKIDLNDMFNRFPGMNLWRLIQELDKRGIEYANRGGLMSLRR